MCFTVLACRAGKELGVQSVGLRTTAKEPQAIPPIRMLSRLGHTFLICVVYATALTTCGFVLYADMLAVEGIRADMRKTIGRILPTALPWS